MVIDSRDDARFGRPGLPAFTTQAISSTPVKLSYPSYSPNSDRWDFECGQGFGPMLVLRLVVKATGRPNCIATSVPVKVGQASAQARVAEFDLGG